MRLLLVEDEAELATVVARLLSAENYVVDHAPDLETAWEAVCLTDYSLVLLDRRLPDGDGLELIRRSKRLSIPPRFLVLSALGDVEDRVQGLDEGAGDYVVKPFVPEELLARIRAELRVPAAEPAQRVRSFGRLQYDASLRSFSVEGQVVVIRRQELIILEKLFDNANRVVTRESIENALYGFNDMPETVTIEPQISRLRKSLSAHATGVEIHSVRGLGYMLKCS
ncbi:response regulator transcription factor [Pacificimonas sp. WHA3]|uniref:Response regulator transcription factor n=1 Tax=Pacificimonas pallii TaxID=2827236 RepID=A0ABS6SGD4_9SPHN|nr:response regulator transcription factor [Pacificimonas pallii]MBV7256976.1 response regulator transcription factor [Pacificimonas pallii]